MTMLCAPLDSLPASLGRGEQAIALYSNAPRAGIGSAGSALPIQCRRARIAPASRAWDLVSIALSVVSADNGFARNTSDGWTRVLPVSIAVIDPQFWQTQIPALERLLGFLTGDVWQLGFTGGGISPSPPRRRSPAPETMVSLLSGGLDSLIGAIDLATAGHRPLLVSQVASGDKTHQQHFAATVGGGLRHLQLNHLVRPPQESEHTYRARSFIFLAYGVLAATSLDCYSDGHCVVDLVLPENGYISLNVPLTPLRVGSLSTRTTHPFYLQQLQAVLTAAGLRVRIVNPYQFTTKGEMLVQCTDQPLLLRLAARSTSCGRFARNAFKHCGRCVPCLIRRAAFHRWGVEDRTTYVHGDLSIADEHHRDFDDVRSAGMAAEKRRLLGTEAWIGASLSSSQLGDRGPYVAVAERGLQELEAYLRASKAL